MTEYNSMLKAIGRENNPPTKDKLIEDLPFTGTHEEKLLKAIMALKLNKEWVSKG